MNSVASNTAIAVRTSSRGSGATSAQVRRPPQQRDLLAQTAPDLAVLGGGQARVVEALQEPGAAPQRHERGPAAGLGRVRGEDWADAQARQHLVELGLVVTGPAQLGDRIGHRVVEEAVARGPLAAAERPDPAARLGEVDELEVERERGDDGLGGAQVQGVEVRGLALRGRRDRPSRRSAMARRRIRSTAS